MRDIFVPTIRAMQAEGRTFCGVLYFGLMLTPNGPKVIEYNARFGDPETQSVLPLLQTSLLDIMEAIIDQRLDTLDIQWANACTACVVLASGGYPGSYSRGYEITGLQDAADTGAIVFHAGTKVDDAGKIVTAGGRVLGVTATGETMEQALELAYRAADCIHFDGMFCRRDIGRR